MPTAEAAQLKGDEIAVAGICPDACHRLEVFHWEWLGDLDAEDREWIRRKQKPVSQEIGVATDGLLEAAEEVATVVQRKLGEFHDRAVPLTEQQAVELWHARLSYMNPLVYLGGNRLAKDVERHAAPSNEALTICVGSRKREAVTTLIGEITMTGYVGCLRIFPDAEYGPGRRWPRLCPSCRCAKTNARNAKKRDLQKLAAHVAASRAAERAAAPS